MLSVSFAEEVKPHPPAFFTLPQACRLLIHEYEADISNENN